jgi:hypothetical protein
MKVMAHDGHPLNFEGCSDFLPVLENWWSAQFYAETMLRCNI